MNGGNLIFIIAVFGLMYVLLIRPGQRRERQRQQLIAQLNPGEEVVTIGGVVGKITGADDSTVDLEVAPGTVIKVVKRAVSHKVVPDGPEEPSSEGEQETEKDAQ